MFDLGLKEKVDKMFHVMGLLEFMHLEASNYKRITFGFLSILELQLEKRWKGPEREYYGDLTFHLYNEEHVLSLKDLAKISGPPLPAMLITLQKGRKPHAFKIHVSDILKRG